MKKRNSMRLVMAKTCVGAGLLISAQAAHAQSAPASPADPQASPTAAGAQPGGGIQDIVVTARRRSESLQSVPVSITAFSQKALTSRSVTSAFDIAKIVPGLTVDADSGNPNTPAFSIRGRGQNYGAAAGSVETYFADVPLSAPFQIPTLPPQFFDLQSFQVLKGPQGTLFGRSTTGGAVSIVPQAPTDIYEGYLRLQGGTYGDFQAEGAINIPIVADKIDLRIAGLHSQRNGYMHTPAGIIDAYTGKPLPAQTYDNIDSNEIRATLRIRPADGIENSTIFTYHEDDNISSPGAGLNIVGVGQPNGLGAYYTPGYGTRTSDLDVDLYHPATKVWAIINTTTFNVSDDITFKNIFGYIHSAGYTDNPSDSDGTNIAPIAIDLQLPARPLENRQITDEVQLQGRALDNKLTWTVGALLDHTREPGSPQNINIYSSVYEFGEFETNFEQNNINSYGVYGAFTYKLTDKLDLSAGFRHSWDDVSFAQAEELGNVSVPTIPLSYFDKKSQGNTYNVTLDYHISNKTMFYGGYRRGYKRGGFNPSESNPALSAFNPETVDDFSVGMKSDFALGTVPARVNLEGYYDLYHGLQVSYLALGAAGLATVTTNVPATTFRGFDLELTLEPTPWLTLHGNYALIDAYNTRWPDPTAGSTIDLKSNPVAYVSRNKLTFTARFHHELSGGQGELAFAPSINYQDEFFTGPLGAVLPEATAVVLGQYDQIAHGGGLVPAYTTVDLRVEWNHVLGSKFDLAVNATNLTNKLYFLGNTGNTLQIGAQANGYGPPRMISADLSFRF